MCTHCNIAAFVFVARIDLVEDHLIALGSFANVSLDGQRATGTATGTATAVLSLCHTTARLDNKRACTSSVHIERVYLIAPLEF
jgi:hypothetical protein